MCWSFHTRSLRRGKVDNTFESHCNQQLVSGSYDNAIWTNDAVSCTSPMENSELQLWTTDIHYKHWWFYTSTTNQTQNATINHGLCLLASAGDINAHSLGAINSKITCLRLLDGALDESLTAVLHHKAHSILTQWVGWSTNFASTVFHLKTLPTTLCKLLTH
jgi:hypothetical protein